MKIRIIGYAGSGKTSLMKKLEDKYEIPGISLDDFLKIKDKQKRFNRVNETISPLPSWIVEGVQISQWTKSSFEEANLIVLLDYPLYISQSRVAKRSMSQLLEPGKTLEQRDAIIKRMFKLFKWNRRFKERLPTVKNTLYNYPVTIMILESPEDVSRLYRFLNRNKDNIICTKRKNVQP